MAKAKKKAKRAAVRVRRTGTGLEAEPGDFDEGPPPKKRHLRVVK